MPKKGSKQSSIASFFGAPKANKKQVDESSALVTKKRIIEEEEEDPGTESGQVVTKESTSTKRRRRVIDDDDDEGEHEFTEDAPVQDQEEETSSKVSLSPGEKKEATAMEEETSNDTTAAETKPAESITNKTNENKANQVKQSTTPAKIFFQPQAASATKKKTVESTTKTTKKETATTDTKDTSSATIHEDQALPKPSDIMKASSKGQFTSDAQIVESIDQKLWPTKDQRAIPYAALCHVLNQIEEISGRLQIQSLLTTLFRQILLTAPEQLNPVVYLASNEVAPAYQCVELGIGDSILIKAIVEATGSTQAQVKSKYESVGDLGIVAMNCKSKQRTLGGFFGSKTTVTAKPKTLTSSAHVLQVFREIAQTKGNQAQKWKVDKIKKLLVNAASPVETKYIIRGLQGKLRIGLAQSTVLISLAHAFALTRVVPQKEEHENDTNVSEKDHDVKLSQEAKQYVSSSETVEKRMEAAVAIVKKAYSEVPSYDDLLNACLGHPLETLHIHCTLKPGIPVAPMLAKPTKSIQEVLTRLNGLDFTCEYKYDGERAQIHLLEDGTAKVFSRNLLDTSKKFPEVPGYVREAFQDGQTVTSFVMDAEVVAYNREKDRLVPFQDLSKRKKEEDGEAKVQIIVQAFDLMFLNGESLLLRSLSERRDLLRKHFAPVQGKFQFAKYIDHKEDGDTTVLEEFLEEAVKGQCEGLMVKTLQVNANYEPSRRSLNWLKLKKDYLDGMGDSVDLVVLGGYYGKGKRTGSYGAYLLACFDPDTEEFASVCKIGTGLSDECLKSSFELLNKHKIPKKSSQYNVSSQLECDVWFDTVAVWEIKAADLSLSPVHRGAVGKTGHDDKGIALRFPRLQRIRDDKKAIEATTSDQILEMYYNQDSVDAEGDDDFEGI